MFRQHPRPRGRAPKDKCGNAKAWDAEKGAWVSDDDALGKPAPPAPARKASEGGGGGEEEHTGASKPSK